MKSDITQLVHRFLEGKASAEDTHTLRELIRSRQHEQTIKAVIDFYTPGRQPDFNSIPSTLEEHATLDRLLNQNGSVVPVERTRQRKTNWWRTAAACISITIFALVFTYNTTNLFQSDTADTIDNILNEFEGKQHLLLPDGSTVVMNKGTRLGFYNSYGRGLREVLLTGEAYFKVKPDSLHAFVVRIPGNVTAEALGTEFNVNAWPENKQVIVTVTKGSVQVFSEIKTSPEVLTPDQQIAINTETHQHNKQVIDAKVAVNWKNKFLILEETSWGDAAEIISVRFKRKIVFRDESLKACKFTASFLEEERLWDVLMVISTVTNTTHMMTSDGTVIIGGKGCK